MFNRNIASYLQNWQTKPNRKPLIIRGARQVGKTWTVKTFGKTHFRYFIDLNLEREADSALFKQMQPISTLIELLKLRFNHPINPGETLIFIDEIQNSEIAMQQLRFFYEEMPNLHIIAAGSLLEVKIQKEGFSFPVGRVEYCYLFPATFDEFLLAMKENESNSYIENLTLTQSIPNEIHSELMKKFQLYTLVGGMPEAVQRFCDTRSFKEIDPIYESLLTGYRDDVHKYASKAKTQYIQHVIEHAPTNCGKLIIYEHFGGSSFKSREMKAAFDTAEKAMLIYRIPATHVTEPPILYSLNKASKLLFLDMGLANYRLDVRAQLLTSDDFNSVFKGQLAEQFVGQTLKAISHYQIKDIAYWYRNKEGSSSEIDFLISINHNLIPIEVKSGKTGTLKSLLRFMETCQTPFAIRVYAGNLSQQTIKLPSGKNFQLISLPFYLLHRLSAILSLTE